MQLTSLVDLASRTLCAAVLRPHGTRAVNATLLLARVVVPEHDAPGWAGALRLRASRLPHRDLGLLRLIATRARSVNFASTVWRSGTGWRSPWYFIGNSTGQASPTGRRPWREPSVRRCARNRRVHRQRPATTRGHRCAWWLLQFAISTKSAGEMPGINGWAEPFDEMASEGPVHIGDHFLQ